MNGERALGCQISGEGRSWGSQYIRPQEFFTRAAVPVLALALALVQAQATEVQL